MLMNWKEPVDREFAYALPFRRRRTAPDAPPVVPAKLLDRIAVACQVQAQQQVNLVVQAPADLPLIDIDPDRMVQVLGNLMSNAFRFTPEGARSAYRPPPTPATSNSR
jgi:signal transduction histidine kinase